MSRRKVAIPLEKIQEAVSKSPSMKRAADLLDVSYTSFIRYAKSYGLYNPNQGLKGGSKASGKTTLDVFKIINNEQTCSSSRLKKLLYKNFIKEAECEICGITGWNNKPLSLHLDHIDGDSSNNDLKNLQILCPNCHSQTSTYCRGQGKSKKTLIKNTGL